MKRPGICLAILLAGFWGKVAQAQTTSGNEQLLLSTGFEAAEGYSDQFTLVGQNGWVGEGTGGNGLVSDFIAGLGQQAFIGFSPPTDTNDFLNIWRPINFAPVSSTSGVVRFSVLMAFSDSTNGHRDDFRWSVYNTNGVRLLTIDFDNQTKQISFALDAGGFIPTGLKFETERVYELVIYLNFGGNLWAATLNGEVLANAELITTTGAALNLGDIDAVWSISNPGAAGDNFMVFDEYTIALKNTGRIPPTLRALGLKNGEFHFRFFGEPGVKYAIDVSDNFDGWFQLGEYVAPQNGIFDFQDDAALQFPRGFYRARVVSGP